jgi:zinc/manganese transport system permease protein
MLAHEFVRNALLAGTPIALASGAVGYFVVLRAQVFAGDALSHVAFTGVLAAAAVGLGLRFGLFAATILVALLLAALGENAEADDVAIGTVLAWVLGLGVLCLDIVSRGSGGGNGAIAARTLFGSIFGLSRSEARTAGLIAVLVLVAVAGLARPLLYATIDPQVARVRGVRVGLLGTVFLVLLGIQAAEATQAVGALLLLGLIAAPAGAALRLTARPALGFALSCGFALASVWIGIATAYLAPSIPPSTAVIGAATGFYAVALATGRQSRQVPRSTTS